MDPNKLNRIVAGERIRDLLPAFVEIRENAWIDDDGMCRSTVRLRPEFGHPFVRAVMRVEAELLLEDADHLGADTAVEKRTPEQRGADAVVALAQRVHQALT